MVKQTNGKAGSRNTTVGILLAAGRGKRFDPSGMQNKLLQPLGAAAGTDAVAGELVVAASARHLLAVLRRVVAVVRPGDDKVAALLGAMGCEVKVCPDADFGMGASLVHAIDYTRGAPGWLVALGDMPHVKPATIARLSDTVMQGERIAAPVYRGKRGNPVAFSPYYLDLLLALDGDQGARNILKSHPVREVDVDDSGILRDIDTPADLAP
jgi:molybdenum cofactor cytidylyltransferase